MDRPYRAVGYPVLPALYMLVAGVIEILLLIEQAHLHRARADSGIAGGARLLSLAKERRSIDVSLFATKPIARILRESEGGAHQLKRTLGPVNLVALGIGAIIGAGLFALTPSGRAR